MYKAQGLAGGSADFSAGSIRVPWSELLNPESYTVTLWARADVRGGGFFRSPITNRDNAGSAWGYMIYNDAAGNWNYWTGNGVSSLWDTLGGGTVQTGQWTHLAISYDAPTTTKRFYVNGVQVNQQVRVVKPNGPQKESLKIGAGGDDSDGLANTFDGRIDDVAVWGRALSLEEINKIRSVGVRAAAERIVIQTTQEFLAPSAIRLTSAGDRPDADPTVVTITGSENRLTFEPVAQLAVPVFVGRGSVQTLEFTAEKPWRYYGIAFSDPVDPTAALMQIAEVELLNRTAADQRGWEEDVDGSGDGVARGDSGATETQVVFVTKSDDEDPASPAAGFSLREALASGGGGIVRFDPNVFRDPGARLFTLAHGELVPALSLAIDASRFSGGMEINGNGLSRILNVGPGRQLTLSNLTLRDGLAPGDGGALLLQGSAVFEHIRVLENTSFGSGGGIAVDGGRLSIKQSTVADNQAGGFAGGIHLENGGQLVMQDSTVARNRGGQGAGLRFANSSGTILQSTIAENLGDGIHLDASSELTMASSTVSANGLVGIVGLGGNSHQLRIENTIVAGNGMGEFSGLVPVDQGGNLIGGDPGLAPLGDYGGPTETMALRYGSPALNAATPATHALRSDQRGFPRRFGPADIGAFESHALSYAYFRDGDGDDIDDGWEVFYGLNPADAADGARDLSGNGQTVRAEFLARINPNDRASRFRILSLAESGSPAPGPRGMEITWSSSPGLVYSVWSSADLVDWKPVAGSNLIALGPVTTLAMASDQPREFYQVRLGSAPGIAPAVVASVQSSLVPVANWTPAGLSPSLDGQPIDGWVDAAGDDHLLANGSPLFVAAASPIGASAARFRGGASDDALVGGPRSALAGANRFTVAIVFKPAGDGESGLRPGFGNKSQLVSALMNGAGNGWGLAYADDALWFGLGDTAAGHATLHLPAGEGMVDRWMIAVASWTSDDGTGKPGLALWLYNEEGNEVARSEFIDPNTLIGSVGAFAAPRADTGIAIGGAWANPAALNFDGQILATQLYGIQANRILASRLAEQLAEAYTTIIRPQ